jgi:hypothetical protein
MKLKIKETPKRPAKRSPKVSFKVEDDYEFGIAPSGAQLRDIVFDDPGLPSLQEIRDEIDDMREVLMGRTLSPHDNGVNSLQETANAYYSRCAELTLLIQRAEVDGYVTKGSALYKTRTGELRTFMELCHRATDVGSRRLTLAQLEWQARHG